MAGVKKTELTFSLQAGGSTFKFQFMEVPSELMGLGGRKLATLIQLEGGQRVVQTFGNVPHDAITWRGIIFGPNSFNRWAEFDGFRTSASPVTLTYGQFKLIGVLEETELLPGFEGYLPYRAKFLVQSYRDLNAIPLAPTQSINQSAAASVSAVTSAAISAQASAIPAVSALGNQSLAAALATQQAIQQTLTTALVVSSGTVGTAAGLVNASAQAAGSAAGIINGVSTAIDVITVSTVVFPLYVALTQLANILATTPTIPQVTVFADGRLTNLFLLATRYFGDPDYWATISLANGGIPPFWTGLLSIIIPNVAA